VRVCTNLIDYLIHKVIGVIGHHMAEVFTIHQEHLWGFVPFAMVHCVVLYFFDASVKLKMILNRDIVNIIEGFPPIVDREGRAVVIDQIVREETVLI
jgi:hypothetical protein